MNAQWNMAFSGEAPNTPEALKAFEEAFKRICDFVDTFSVEHENHLNDNAQFYTYDDQGVATMHHFHEPVPMKPGEALPPRTSESTEDLKPAKPAASKPSA